MPLTPCARAAGYCTAPGEFTIGKPGTDQTIPICRAHLDALIDRPHSRFFVVAVPDGYRICPVCGRPLRIAATSHRCGAASRSRYDQET